MTAALRRPDEVPAPPRLRWRLVDTDVAAATAALTVCVVGMWLRHGGLRELTAGWTLCWTSLTDLSGLAASALALVALVLVARPRFFERTYGLDRTFVWHRQIGGAMAVALAVHVGAGVAATIPGRGWSGAAADLSGGLPYMALATVGALLVGIVTVTSLRSLRRRLAYETWYFVHLLAYAGMAIAFSHEIVLGSDLATDTVARWFWILLHVVVLAALVLGRWRRSFVAAWRPLRIARVERTARGMATITLTGSPIAGLGASAGQFFLLRPLHPDLWWQAHPFSLSAAPTAHELRFTIKDRGDASGLLARLRPGERVAVEGPYGVNTPDALAGDRLLFVAGGIGIAPVRALVEALPAQAAPVVLYRARHRDELVHLDELEALVAARGGRVLTLVGPSARLAARDPFQAAALLRAVPDLRERTAVLCGPERLLHAARHGLHAAGVPYERIHFERPWW